MNTPDQDVPLSEETLDSITGGSLVVDFRIRNRLDAETNPVTETAFVPTTGADRME